MGRIAATLRPTASVPTDGGLLLDPTTDLWPDWGLLGVPDPVSRVKPLGRLASIKLAGEGN